MGYEQNLAFLLFSVSVLMIVKSLKNPKLIVIALPVLSLTTYADYAQRLVIPILFGIIFVSFRKNLDIKKNIKYINSGILMAFLIQIPNLYILTTPSFFTKTNHFYFNVIFSQATKIEHYLPAFIAIPLSFLREFFSQFFIYFSPRSLFFLPDSDLQRSMPELSVFYVWEIIPYIIGLYIIGKNRKNASIKLIILLLPLTLVMSLGIDKLIYKRKKALWIPISLFLMVFSLIMLWRSYFILLPQERSDIWGFEYPILANYIKEHPSETFVIDQSSRTRPQDLAYTQMAFYLKLDPKELQNDQKIDIAKRYYYDINFSFIHKFANVETRQMDWGETNWREIVLVGDQVSISDPEVKLHNLTQIFEIKDPNNVIILRGFKTNPKKTH